VVSTSAISQKVLGAIQQTGVTATLVDPNATYATSGTVTEVPVSTSVQCSPLVDESRRWNDPSITATVYISAYNMSVRPRPGFRLTHTGRTFVVIGAFPYSIHDVVIAWRLDLGEVA